MVDFLSNNYCIFVFEKLKKMKKSKAIKITKELFIKIMNDVELQHKKDESFDNAVKELSVLGDGFLYNYDLVEHHLIDILERVLNNEEWVTWWMYDTKFGESKPIVGFNDVKYQLKTSSDLWDFVHENFENLTKISDEEENKSVNLNDNEHDEDNEDEDESVKIIIRIKKFLVMMMM